MYDRIIKSVWRFEHSVVTSNQGGLDTISSGREVSRRIQSAGLDARAGQPVLSLGSSRGDLPMIMGVSPWIVG
jgi:hypothetical protein